MGRTATLAALLNYFKNNQGRNSFLPREAKTPADRATLRLVQAGTQHRLPLLAGAAH